MTAVRVALVNVPSTVSPERRFALSSDSTARTE
jgi:hypothetical protein